MVRRDAPNPGKPSPVTVGTVYDAARHEPGLLATSGPSKVQVLAKFRQLLDAFSPRQPVLTLSELRSITALPASTCFRLVQNLVDQGLLERIGDRYRVGPAAIRWAASAIEARSIVTDAAPVLEGLRDSTGESAHLVVRDGAFRICIALANSHRSVVRLLRIGEVVPLHVGSMGKAFLAFDPEAIPALKGNPLEAFTTSTITDWEELDSQLVAIRALGYAVSVGERDVDAVGITAPVYDHQACMVAGVGISGPVQRMGEQRIEEYAAAVVSAAHEMSTDLGCQLYV